MTAVLLPFIAAFMGCLLLVRKLRYERRDTILRKYPHYHDSKSLGKMTLEDAFTIELPLAELEFPITFSVSIFLPCSRFVYVTTFLCNLIRQ